MPSIKGSDRESRLERLRRRIRGLAPTADPRVASARRCQLLIAQLREMAIFTLRPDGRIASWNPGVQRLFGYEEHEFIGRPIELIFTPEDVAAGVPASELAEALADGEASDDRWLMRKDGERVWAAGVTTRMLDERGGHLGFGKVIRDRTDVRELQERLAESEQRLRITLSAAQIGTWRWDVDTELDIIDGNLARMLGLGDDDMEILFEEFLDRVHPEDREATRGAFAEAVRTAGGLRVEFRTLRPDGGVRWVRDYGEAVTDDDGRVRYLTGALVDVTEQRIVEENVRQSQRMESVGKLAGGVAHEVNNMMGVVIGFTDLLLQEPGAARWRGDLERVRTAAGRAAEVTAQLLAFSRRQLLRPSSIDIGELVREMEPVLRRLVSEDRALVVRATAALKHCVHADRGQLEQILINLAVNARDATQAGDRIAVEVDEIRVDIDFLRGRPGLELDVGEFVTVAVIDTGRGIDAAAREHLFEPFFTTKPAGQGTGLGLSVVHGIVRQSGGDIEVESAPGEGTSMRIYLPALRTLPEGEPALSPERARQAEVPLGDGYTVLVVEDEPLVRTLVTRTLTRLGYRCLEAADGVHALELLEASSAAVDVVLSDLVMPRMGGRALAERLGELRPGVPILFMSGYTDDEVVRRDLLGPGAPFIQKPFTPRALAERLHSLLAATPRRGESS